MSSYNSRVAVCGVLAIVWLVEPFPASNLDSVWQPTTETSAEPPRGKHGYNTEPTGASVERSLYSLSANSVACHARELAKEPILFQAELGPREQ